MHHPNRMIGLSQARESHDPERDDGARPAVPSGHGHCH